jgi:hypothetical protein
VHLRTGEAVSRSFLYGCEIVALANAYAWLKLGRRAQLITSLALAVGSVLALTSCAPVVDIASSASSGDASTSASSEGGAGGSAFELRCHPSHECGTKLSGAICEIASLDLDGTCANSDGGAPKCCAFANVH